MKERYTWGFVGCIILVFPHLFLVDAGRWESCIYLSSRQPIPEAAAALEKDGDGSVCLSLSGWRRSEFSGVLDGAGKGESATGLVPSRTTTKKGWWEN